jgi:[ribosomal protein S5]-alanine N-acetyltransferase
MAWIEAQRERARDGVGVSRAITAAGSDEALGCIVATGCSKRARRRGLASGAVALLTRWALADAGMVRIEALVEPGNVASQWVVENAGFQREGLLRAYIDLELDGRRSDAYIYSLLADDM